ncbi:sensor histidine kinase [Pseudoduganella aquatica]|uniref:sensor histidine kinase n=1 Tax=Pseudoduganella aquatica TaxID=2660641 RepID=UPI001E2C3F18|nr:ATP-binding protein [Pseudoduganella aquatica]
MIVDFYTRERAQLLASTVTQARAIMAAVDSGFARTEAALLALGTSHQLQRGDLAGFHSRAVEAQADMHADGIVLIDPDGRLLLSTRRPYGERLPKLASAPLLKRILATGRPGVSDLFPSPVDGQLIYTIGVPIRRGADAAMTLNATATPARLAGLLAERSLPRTWRVAIVDGSGKIAARSHDIERFVGRPTTSALQRQLALADEGGFETTTLDGIPVYSVFSRSATSRWSVALGIPLDELTAGLRRSLAWLIVATLAALAAGLGLAWRIGGGIARSVQALAGPAAAVAAGVVPEIPPLALREANELGLALQQAAASVRTAQAERRESEQQLALAAEAARLGIWVRDLVQGKVWVSSSWRELFGFLPSEQISVAALLQRVHTDDCAAVRRVLALADTGERYEIEYRVALPQGGLRWVASRGSCETGGDGKPRLVRGVALDITQRKLAELAMQQKQREVTHLARVATLGELSGALAHELNQPLTAILSNAQAAQRFLRQATPDLDEVGDILADIVAEDQRAGEIIRRLRRLFDKRETPLQPAAVNPLVIEVLRLLRNDLLSHGVALSTVLGAEDAHVLADSVQLQQVLINLLMNAVDAMAMTDAGARAIGVRTGLDDEGWLRISIADCGSGIPNDALDQVFAPFYTTKDSGMGLGLSICRSIVAAHGGQLWAENNPDGGASFHVRLPLAAAAETAAP